MASYNHIELLGNIGSVDIKTFQSGSKIVEASLATTKRWKDRDGELREDTQWHKLIIGGPRAEVAEKFIRKGDQLFVSGEMKYRKYEDREGKTRISPEVRVLDFQLLGKKESAAADAAPAKAPAPASDPADAYDNGSQAGDDNYGDLPF